MTPEPIAGLTPYLAILAMGAATYAMRAGGLWFAARFPLTPRMQRFLEYLAGSIMVALVVPLALQGGPVLMAAVALGAVLAVVTGRGWLAVAGAVALAAGLRQAGLG